MSIFSDQLLSKAEMSPEYVEGKLFSFHNIAHHLHLTTNSYEVHKALDFLYSSLEDAKDDISEKLMGYVGRKTGKIKLDDVPIYSIEAVNKLVEEGLSFSYKLYRWAEEKNYCDVENKAQELSGIFAKTRYLLSLK